LVVLVDTPRERAAEVCERLRLAAEQHAWPDITTALRCAVSLGLSMFSTTDSMTTWLARADSLLYKAKRSGRNRVAGAGP
jgi:diguanylate cyclase (GGDEF)-like protein